MAEFIVVHSVKVATDFVPETFGRLTTIGPIFWLPVGSARKHRKYQVCQCVCGNIVSLSVANLVTSQTQSCGCLHKERLRQRLTKHGRSHTREHVAWTCLIQRCYNPNDCGYANYGGRGIRVCGRWLEPDGQGFINFIQDMGGRPSKGHSIDRIDVNSHYCPENCRWATRTEQNRNQRTNHVLTFNGKTQCLAAWTEELGYHKDLIRNRLYLLGWSVDKALQTPPRSPKQKIR